MYGFGWMGNSRDPRERQDFLSSLRALKGPGTRYFCGDKITLDPFLWRSRRVLSQRNGSLLRTGVKTTVSETPRYGISGIVLRHVASLFSVVPSSLVYNDIYLTRNYASELHGKVANGRERERKKVAGDVTEKLKCWD